MERSLGTLTLCSIPLGQQPFCHSRQLFAEHLEVQFPPGLLWVHPSFTPSLLLLQITLTEGYVSAEPADPPLHFTPKKQTGFPLKSRERGSEPSLSVGLLAHWGTPRPTLHLAAEGMVMVRALGSPSPLLLKSPVDYVLLCKVLGPSFALPEMMRLQRTEALGRMLQACRNIR